MQATITLIRSSLLDASCELKKNFCSSANEISPIFSLKSCKSENLYCVKTFAAYPIILTSKCNEHPEKPHNIEKSGFTGFYIILLILAQKHRLWIPARTALLRQFYYSTHNNV